MRLSTIWTLPGMTLAERLRRTRDTLTAKAAHLLPRRLAYWVLIDQGVRHMHGDEVVPDVSFMAVLQRAGAGVES